MNVTPIMNEYSERDIYNKKYIELFYKIVPQRRFIFKHEKCRGIWENKEPLTSVVVCNMDCSDKPKVLHNGTSKNGTFL